MESRTSLSAKMTVRINFYSILYMLSYLGVFLQSTSVYTPRGIVLKQTRGSLEMLS